MFREHWDASQVDREVFIGWSHRLAKMTRISDGDDPLEREQDATEDELQAVYHFVSIGAAASSPTNTTYFS
jgi:hypothetical protein